MQGAALAAPGDPAGHVVLIQETGTGEHPWWYWSPGTITVRVDQVVEVLLPRGRSFPTGIAAAGDRIWFGEGFGNRIGVLRRHQVDRLAGGE